MIRSEISLSITFVLIVLMAACSSDDTNGFVEQKITFAFHSNLSSNGNRASSESLPAEIQLDIRTTTGDIVESDLKLGINSFGGSYYSSSIVLLEGDYELTKFLVLDEDENVIYAAPIE